MIPVTAEVNDTGVILFAHDYPGACGWGADEMDALARLRRDLDFTVDWLTSHGLDDLGPSAHPSEHRLEVVETVPATGDPLVCDTEGFFAVDDRGYRDGDVEETRRLLAASRTDLLASVADLGDAHLDRRLDPDRRTIREIVHHVADAEHWYLTRVGAPVDVGSSATGYPSSNFERLAAIREDVTVALAALADHPRDRRDRTGVRDGERWSHAKVLWRLVWHELLHLKQVDRLVDKVTGGPGPS